MKISRLSAFFAAFLLLGSLLPLPAAQRAFAGPSRLPTVINLYEAYAFRNVAQQGDFVVVGRFQLPISQWDISNGGPGNGAALTELYNGSTLLGRRITPWYGDSLIPKVGDGLTGIYLGPANGVAWGSSSVKLCITGDPTIFVSPLQVCLIPVYEDAANVAASRIVIGNQVVAMMGALEANAGVQVNSYVLNNIITLAGTGYATDGFAVITQTSPQSFALGVNDTGDNIYTPPAEGAYSSSTQSTARASTLYHNLTNFNGEYFSIQPQPLGIFASFIVSLLVMSLMLFLLHSMPHSVPIAGAIGCFLFFALSVGFGIIGMGYMFLAFAVLILIGLFWMARRIPG